MEKLKTMSINSRLGIHYFPDSLHYREQDLNVWLPRLEKMGMSWLTMLAPLERAIPESFITGIINKGVNPILHFQFPAGFPVNQADLRLLFYYYARWGVQYVSLFDRPNCRSSWHPATWSQLDLVERFLDLYLPLADLAIYEGLTPVFSPLEPGGDYWDLAFLQTALKGIQRRGAYRVLEKLILGAYAWTNGKSLLWGKGGPDSFPKARPYYTPEGQQDHLGFHIFDWYLAVAKKELGHEIPLIILRAGEKNSHSGRVVQVVENLEHTDLNLEIAHMMQVAGNDQKVENIISPNVLACNFWLLASEPDSPFASQSWFRTKDEPLPVVDAFKRFVSVKSIVRQEQIEKRYPDDQDDSEQAKGKRQVIEKEQPTITHYVLLPLYAWGAADWDLDLIQPLIQHSHPTIGFSLSEARLAQKVTVVGGEGAISDDAIEMLRDSGCFVERIREDGTLIAT